MWSPDHIKYTPFFDLSQPLDCPRKTAKGESGIEIIEFGHFHTTTVSVTVYLFWYDPDIYFFLKVKNKPTRFFIWRNVAFLYWKIQKLIFHFLERKSMWQCSWIQEIIDLLLFSTCSSKSVSARAKSKKIIFTCLRRRLFFAKQFI